MAEIQVKKNKESHEQENGKVNTSITEDPSSESNANTAQAQAGVKRIEAISQTWTKSALVIAYVRQVLS